MRHVTGLDASLEETSICVADEAGAIAREAKVASDPEALATWLGGLGRMRSTRRPSPPRTRRPWRSAWARSWARSNPR